MGLRGLQQPVQKSLMLRGAAFTVEILSQMPVRGVEDAHNCSMQKSVNGIIHVIPPFLGAIYRRYTVMHGFTGVINHQHAFNAAFFS
ncbi:hypothetical protein IVW58_17985 [Salmonella enterica subsp. enterica serovar Worthington]|nr:hypothetical protein [Salmonella enterica subsp. enterica serovar Worthington]